jgi:hypothetical protein
MTVALLGYGYCWVHIAQKKACAEGGVCETPRVARWVKVTLSVSTGLAIAGLGVEFVEPYLLGAIDGMAVPGFAGQFVGRTI